MEATNIWVPDSVDYNNSGSDSEPNTDSEEWQDPSYNPQFEYHNTNQELRTMIRIVEDIIKTVILPTKKY